MAGAAETCPTVVRDAIRKAIGSCDGVILDTAWQWCRKACDDLAPDELVQFVRKVAPRVCQPGNHSWPVVMRKALVNAVADRDEVLTVRRQLAEWREREERQREESIAAMRWLIDDPDTTEELRQWYRDECARLTGEPESP